MSRITDDAHKCMQTMHLDHYRCRNADVPLLRGQWGDVKASGTVKRTMTEAVVEGNCQDHTVF